jgi:DNA modification methylase
MNDIYEEEEQMDLDGETHLNTKMKIEDVYVNVLKPHPISIKIYEYRKSKKQVKILAETMRMIGQLEPIIINQDNQIISGNLRVKAAIHNEWKTIKAIRVNQDREKEHLDIVFHNQQRRKTPKEIINEAEAILGLLGKRQGQRTDLLKQEGNNPFGKIGEDRFSIAAKVIGDISATTLRRMMDVVEFEKQDKQNTSFGLVEKIINNELSVSRAHNLMNEIVRAKKEVIERKEREVKEVVIFDDFKIYQKSSSNMDEVGNESVQVVFTSPPYYNLRNYGNSTETTTELGHERTPQEFITNLTNHLRDVKRVLKREGSFFLNIGETIKDRKNLLIPTRLLLHLCDQEGYSLVNEIIWKKASTMPQTTTHRLQPTYEKIFHLVKDTSSYYYNEFKLWKNNEEVEIIRGTAGRTMSSNNEANRGYTLVKSYTKFRDFIDEQSVKSVIVGPNASVRQRELQNLYPLAEHPALMPDYLPIIPILTTSNEGDIVLDPFSGSGTTGRTALLLGRRYIGYEINERNVEISKADLEATLKERIVDEVKVDEII